MSGIAKTVDIKNIEKDNEKPLSYNDFRSQVNGGWENVYPPIRKRMDRLLTSLEPVTFEGRGCVRHSKMGWVFACLSKMLGSPLVLKQGEDVKTIVTIKPTKSGFRC